MSSRSSYIFKSFKCNRIFPPFEPYQLIAEKLETEFGCVVPWVPLAAPEPSSPLRKICDFGTDDTRRSQVMDRFDYLSSSGLSGLCPLPCSTMEVFLGELSMELKARF